VSVYVDPLLNCVPNRNWRWNQSSHLFADTLDELHSFAARIGLKRQWFQDKQDFPHYDLNPSRRVAAVRAGVIEVSTRRAVEHMQALRAARLAAEEKTLSA
jgi:Protein of unknown function (DUF4031)